MSTTHPYRDLASMYALDVLDGAERAEFEAHLAECSECQAELREMREVVGLLGHATAPATPPAGLRARILDIARNAPRESGNAAAIAPGDTGAVRGTLPADTTTEGPAVHSLAARQRPTANRGRSPAARSGFGSWAPWLATAAALILAMIAGLGFLQEREARLALEENLRAAETTLVERDALIANVLGADVRVARLTVDGEAPRMQLFWNQQRRVLVLSAYNLPPAPEGRVYQLWGIPQDGPPISLGTFNSERDGTTTTVLSVPDAALSVSAVTEEPQGGSPQPTTTPFLVGSWSAGE